MCGEEVEANLQKSRGRGQAFSFMPPLFSSGHTLVEALTIFALKNHWNLFSHVAYIL